MKVINGCVIVKETPDHVLCLWHNEVTPFVVWTKDGGDHVSMGNYCKMLHRALEVLSERSGIPKEEL